MIKNNKIRSVRESFPILKTFITNPYMEKVEIKTICQLWNGETLEELGAKYPNNPYTLRIGLPHIDQQMRQDRIHFIQSYLSYNPITKNIEKREIIPYRNVEKVYIGQSAEEEVIQDYKLFVAGNTVSKDFILMENGKSLVDLVNTLTIKVQKLESEIADLKLQSRNETIYK
jgi:hypothetical protein